MPVQGNINPGQTNTEVRLFSVINDTTEAVPPGGAMRVVSIDTDGIAHVAKPNTNGQVDGILFNGISLIQAGGYGSGTQDFPTIAAYSQSGGLTRSDNPRTGDVWGTVEDSWYLSKNSCGAGYYILGSAVDGLVNVTVADDRQRKFRITAKTETICGNSGSTVRSGTTFSGSNATDHAVYVYQLHSVHAVDDGDGCPQFLNDDIDVALVVEEAYEQNNNSVAIGTIVDAERIIYNDESVSGSQAGSGSDTTGPVGCRWIFSAGTQASPSVAKSYPEKYRYFCVSGIQKEYLETFDGQLTFVRNNGCCDCTDFGSGSGAPGDCDECDPGDTLCVTVDGENSYLNDVGCQPPQQITVTRVLQNAISNWYVGNTVLGNVTWRAWVVINCGVLYGVGIGIPYGDTTSCLLKSPPTEGDFCTLPQTVTLNCDACPFDEGSGLTATISVGECVEDILDSGSSGDPDCPCYWHFILASWLQVSGPAGCINPVDIPAEDTYRYTTLDGTAECTPDSSAGTTTCPDCSTVTSYTYAKVSSSGFLSSFPSSGSLTVFDATNCIYRAINIPLCDQTGSLYMWCEAGTWYMGVFGAGQGFAANSGGSQSSMTFVLNYTTANTFCPGVTGQLTVTVVSA